MPDGPATMPGYGMRGGYGTRPGHDSTGDLYGTMGGYPSGSPIGGSATGPYVDLGSLSIHVGDTRPDPTQGLQGELSNLRDENNRLRGRIRDLERQLEDYGVSTDYEKKVEISRLTILVDDLRRQNTDLNDENRRLKGRLREANDALARMREAELRDPTLRQVLESFDRLRGSLQSSGDLNDQLRQEKEKSAGLQAQLDTLMDARRHQPPPDVRAAENRVAPLLERLHKMERDLAELRGRFGERDPRVRVLEANVANSRRLVESHRRVLDQRTGTSGDPLDAVSSLVSRIANTSAENAMLRQRAEAAEKERNSVRSELSAALDKVSMLLSERQQPAPEAAPPTMVMADPASLAKAPLSVDVASLGVAIDNMMTGSTNATVFLQNSKASDKKALMSAVVALADDILNNGASRMLVVSKDPTKAETDVLKAIGASRDAPPKAVRDKLAESNNIKFVDPDMLVRLLRGKRSGPISNTTFVLLDAASEPAADLIVGAVDGMTSKLLWALPDSTVARNVKTAINAANSMNLF